LSAVLDATRKPSQPVWLGAQELKRSPALVGGGEALVEQVRKEALDLGWRLGAGPAAHFSFQGLEEAQDAGKFGFQFINATRGCAMFAKISQLRPGPKSFRISAGGGGPRESGSYGKIGWAWRMGEKLHLAKFVPHASEMGEKPNFWIIGSSRPCCVVWRGWRGEARLPTVLKRRLPFWSVSIRWEG